MITVNNPSVVVPPVPSPRNNKKIIQGKFTITDLCIIIPNLIVTLVIIFCCKMPIWASILVVLGFIILTAALIWPLGFLGQDKLYIFIFRGIKFLVGEQKLFTSDDLIKVKTKNTPANTSKAPSESKKVTDMPDDFLTKMFTKKEKNKAKKK